GKMIRVNYQVQSTIAEHRVKTLANPIERDDLQICGLLKGAAVAVAAKNRIVGQDGRGGSEPAAESEIFVTGLIPRSATKRLAKPARIVGQRLETTAATTIIGRAPIPKAVT